MHSYEIEIKVLLGTPESKNKFLSVVEEKFPNMTHSYSESQRNHYFEKGNLSDLLRIFRDHISHEEASSLEKLISEAKSFSVRTRGTREETILVVKATVNDETSSNGTARIEWEVDLAPMTLDEMDAKVVEAGFYYQAKWSRDRDEYRLSLPEQNPPNPLSQGGIALCIDRNAGYGYLAEFERVITDADAIDQTRTELLAMIESIGYHELDQDRLARMFDFYNQNWREYYGTERVFVVE